MSVYFSHQDGNYPPKFPTCDYVEIYQGQYSVSLKVRPNDPRVVQAKKDGELISEIHCGIHYFDDTGFPICKICGWCPIK